MAQTDGISVGEAVRRARLQEKLNRAIIRFENDPDYAGAWIEQDSKTYRMKLGFRGGRKPALNDPELQEVTEFESTSRSLGDLAQARANLAKVLKVHDIKGAFTVDQRTQRMEFFPLQPDRLKALIAAGTVVIPDFVEVKDGPLIDRPEADVYGAGSMDVRTPLGALKNCTGGFVVQGADSTGATVRGLTTAAHCEEDAWNVEKHRGLAIGTLLGYVLYDRGLDVAWYRNSTLTYLPRVRLTSSSYYTVTSVGPQLPGTGTTICLVKRDERQICSRYLNSLSIRRKDRNIRGRPEHSTRGQCRCCWGQRWAVAVRWRCLRNSSWKQRLPRCEPRLLHSRCEPSADGHFGGHAMTIALRAFVVLCVGLGLAGCHSTPQWALQQQRSTHLSSAALIGNWRLIDLDGVALRHDSASVNLQPNGRFVATVYCNYAKGLYTVEGRFISFDGWDATERGCNEEMPQVDRIETALRGDGYTFSLDTNGDILLSGPARLRLRRS